MRALAAGRPIPLRNPAATRPWQHVLEPLGGYLRLAEALATAATSDSDSPNPYGEAFNFGPALEANRPVRQLIEAALRHWPGQWQDLSEAEAPHEAGRLHLQIDKAHHQLGWQPRWPFTTTVQRTVAWYRQVASDPQAAERCCLAPSLLHKQSGDSMSIRIKRSGAAVEVLQGADTLPEVQPVELYTDAEQQQRWLQRMAELDVQMPSFLRGDEGEDAAELFHL